MSENDYLQRKRKSGTGPDKGDANGIQMFSIRDNNGANMRMLF